MTSPEAVRMPIPNTTYDELKIQLDAIAEARAITHNHNASTAAFDEKNSDETQPLAKMMRQDRPDGPLLCVDAAYAPDTKDAVFLTIEHENSYNRNRYVKRYVAEMNGDVFQLVEDDAGERGAYLLGLEESDEISDIVRRSAVMSYA